MQSGITASADLHTAFQTLVSDPSQRGLLVTITNESLVPLHAIPSSSTFLSDLSLLSPHLSPTVPLYILLRQHASARPDGFIVAITYVPDAAPVRQKMLFASTRLALVRELGTERFCESRFVTEMRELEADGWERHERSKSAAAPLTGEEEALKILKEAEAEARGGGGMVGRRLEVGSRSKMGMMGDVRDALERLKEGRKGDNLVQLRINIQTETIELAGTSSATTDTLATAITDSEPRYSFFRFSPDKKNDDDDDGDHDTAIVFVYTCPFGSKIKERMVYASSKLVFVNAVKSEMGLDVVKTFEVSNPAEITKDLIEDEFRPRPEEKKAFERPKRPGRR